MTRAPRLITLVLLTMATTLSLNMFLPALPQMAVAFEVDYGVISLSVGGYLAVTAVLSLILGPLSDRWGRRPVALGVGVIFTTASVGAALAQEITVFLACRFAQGVMVGGFILASAVVRDTREDREVAQLLAYITSAMAIAPLLGPMIGGVVEAALGWRAVFWIYAGLGAVMTVVLAFDLRETRVAGAAQQVGAWRDFLGLGRFWALVAMIALSTSCFYAFLAATPLVAVAMFGLAGPELGVALGSITLGFMAASFAAGKLSLSVGPRKLMIAGRLATLLGLTGGLLSTSIWPGAPLALFGATIFIGVGNGLSIPTGNALAMEIRPQLAGTATGIIGAATVGTGAIMTTLAGWALAGHATGFAMTGFLWVMAAGALAAGLAALRLPR